MTTDHNVTDIATRVARLELLVTSCPSCAAALRTERETLRRARHAQLRAIDDHDARAAQFRALPSIDKREVLAIDFREALAFLGGFSPEDVELVIEHLPSYTREQVEIRHRKVEARVRISTAPAWPPSRTPGRQLAPGRDHNGQWLDDDIAKKLEVLGLGHLVNREADNTRTVYVGWYADRMAQPTLTRDQWCYLLDIDPALQSLVNRNIVTVEELDEEQSAQAQLDEWAVRNTPRSRGMDTLPRKAVADTAKTREKIRGRKKRSGV